MKLPAALVVAGPTATAVRRSVLYLFEDDGYVWSEVVARHSCMLAERGFGVQAVPVSGKKSRRMYVVAPREPANVVFGLRRAGFGTGNGDNWTECHLFAVPGECTITPGTELGPYAVVGSDGFIATRQNCGFVGAFTAKLLVVSHRGKRVYLGSAQGAKFVASAQLNLDPPHPAVPAAQTI